MPAASTTGQFDQRLDHDYFKVTLAAGERYLFRMVPGSASGTQRPTLELWAPGSPDNGFNPTASDSRVLLLAESGEARFAYVAETSGTYFLRASHSPIDATPRTDTGSYTVSVESIALDDHSDLPSLGTALAAGATLAGTIDQRRDHDFFRVEMAAGERLLFSMNGSGGTPLINAALSVRSPSGVELVEDSVATSSGGAKIAFVAPVAGTYQVLARAWPDDVGPGNVQDLGGYSISAASVAADDHADTAALGTVLGAGATVNGAFDLRHDLDHFRVTLTAGQRYLLSMTGAGATPVLGSTLQLFAPDASQFTAPLSTPLVNDTATTANGGAKFSFVAPTSGTYDLLATLSQGASGGNGDTGTYSVSLASLAADDHADLRASGTVLAIGATANGQFDQRYDVDAFRVNLVEGQRYTFTMKGAGATPIKGAMLQLFDPNGDPTEKVDVGFDVTGSIPPELRPFLPPGLGLAEAKFVFTASMTGTHYLIGQVGNSYAAVGSATGSYTLAAASTTVDDHPDRILLGTPLAANTTVNGSFDFRHDVDYFHVSLTEGQRYHFTLTPTSGGTADIVSMTLTPGVESHIANDLSTSTSDPAKFAYVAPLTGTYYLRVEGQQSFSLSGAVTQTYTLRYTPIALDDHSDLRDSATVLLAGGPPPNQPPQVTDGASNTLEDTAVSGALPTATDPDGDPLTYAKASDPSHGAVVVNANGSYTYTPAANYSGNDSFTFSVSDGRGGSTTQSFLMVVSAVNDAPTLANPLPDQAATADATFAYTVPANSFADVDGPSLSYNATRGDGGPLPAWLTFNANTRSFSGTPANSDEGSVSILVSASDGSAGASDSFTLTISRGTNNAPVAAPGNAIVAEDAVLNGQLSAATDADGDPITYAVAGQPANGTVTVNSNGSYRYTPNSNYHGPDTFVFVVSDGRGGSNSYPQAISVGPVNDAPTGSVSISGTAARFETLQAGHTLADVDGLGSVSYQWLRGGAPIAGATASSYTLVEADVGQLISVRASYTDGGGTAESATSSATAAVTSGINPINGTPGPDSLIGTAGRDSILAGSGDDYIRAAFGSDTIDGGAGYDVASFTNNAAVQVDMRTGTVTSGADVDQLISIEVIFGSTGNDTMRGIDQPANVQGDRLRGGLGSDTINGGTGVDTAEYLGARAGYQLQRTGNTITLTDTNTGNGDDGVDILIDMERLIFADQFLAFGTRAEELARVAFVLWSPEIIASTALFARGYSFYDAGYDFATMCSVALQFHAEVGQAFATKLINNMPGTTRTVEGLMTLMANAGGGDPGRAAAVAAMAMDDIVGQKLIDKGVIANGVIGSLVVDGFGQLFGLMPGA